MPCDGRGLIVVCPARGVAGTGMGARSRTTCQCLLIHDRSAGRGHPRGARIHERMSSRQSRESGQSNILVGGHFISCCADS